jgi:excisionase family DNA binding protein
MSDKPLSTREAAEIARKHQRTIVAWIRKGMLPAMKFEGLRGPYLIKREDLMDLLAKRYTPRPYQPEEPEKP